MLLPSDPSESSLNLSSAEIILSKAGVPPLLYCILFIFAMVFALVEIKWTCLLGDPFFPLACYFLRAGTLFCLHCICETYSRAWHIAGVLLDEILRNCNEKRKNKTIAWLANKGNGKLQLNDYCRQQRPSGASPNLPTSSKPGTALNALYSAGLIPRWTLREVLWLSSC